MTTGGYAGSKMHTTVLPVYAAALQKALNNHIISHRELLTTAVSTTGNSNAGAGQIGYASSWEWKDCLLRLMSEIQIYGSTVLSSSFYDTGNANIFVKAVSPLFQKISKPASNILTVSVPPNSVVMLTSK